MPAVKVENLSKEYVIGAGRTEPQTFRGRLAGILSAPLRGRGGPAGARAGTRRFWALKDVSFEVEPGEVVGIIGRNGAGKSTLLKILSRIAAPTSGRVELSGRMSSLLEVGTGFHPELTGRENVFLNGSLLGMSRAEIGAKFDEIVAFAEVDRFLDTPVKHYSSGMYVRLAFAVAAHLDPEIIVVDEVLAVGDTQFQRKCFGKMEEAERRGRTVLLVSHNMNAVKRLCDRCLFLENGSVRVDADVDSAIAAYLGDRENRSPVVGLEGSRDAVVNGVEALSIELMNPAGGAFALPCDQPIRLRIRYRIAKRLADASFAIGCGTVDDIPVFTVRSAEAAGAGVDVDARAEHEVAVEIPHNLSAGVYILQLGVSSGGHVRYYNPCAARLEVLDRASRNPLETNAGLIRLGSTWSL